MSREENLPNFNPSNGPLLSDSDEFEELSDDFETENENVQVETSLPQVDVGKQQEMRKLIMSITSDPDIPAPLKARKIQELMTSEWKKKQPVATGKKTNDELSEEDLKVTYHDEEKLILGCKHYSRNNKLKANCCGGWFTCRFCHNDVSDHQIVRKETKTMMCMFCQTVQPASQRCINEGCGKEMARYFCSECVLWDDTPFKSIYHCPDCGICRVGQGLDKDYFHCKKCNVCMAISLRNRHKCIERNLESDCPICGEYMFTSTTTVIFMPCGHCIHYVCHRRYVRTSYQCPTCLKSLADMTQYFQSLDALMESQQMPPQYEHYRSVILCNDCEKKSVAKYHFLYHKCASCNSYNTKTIKVLRDEEEMELTIGSLFNADGTVTSPEPGDAPTVTHSSNATLIENGMDFDQDWSQHGNGIGNGDGDGDGDTSDYNTMDTSEASSEPEFDSEHP